MSISRTRLFEFLESGAILFDFEREHRGLPGIDQKRSKQGDAIVIADFAPPLSVPIER